MDFRRTARIAVGAAIVELVMGGVLFGLVPQPRLFVVLPVLAILFGTIVILCVVAIPRWIRLSLIAALAILFVLMGSRITLMGTAVRDVPMERADATGDPAATARGGDRRASVAGSGERDSGERGSGERDSGGRDTGPHGAWTTDIGAVLAQAGQGGGARIRIDRVSVEDGTQPERVGIEWSVEAIGGRTACASLTISVADRQAALDAIGAVLRAALDRSRATGRPFCY